MEDKRDFLDTGTIRDGISDSELLEAKREVDVL
jgi:hypothetical protein